LSVAVVSTVSGTVAVSSTPCVVTASIVVAANGRLVQTSGWATE
jgi:hypothetical protein